MEDRMEELFFLWVYWLGNFTMKDVLLMVVYLTMRMGIYCWGASTGLGQREWRGI